MSSFLPDNLGGLLISALAVVLLILGVGSVILFFNSGYDEGKESAEAYLEDIVLELQATEQGYNGTFSFWAPETVDESEYYLVYFGSKLSISDLDEEFIYRKSAKENNLCVCYTEDDYIACTECESLNFPALLGGKDSWAHTGREKLLIKFDGSNYVFSTS